MFVYGGLTVACWTVILGCYSQGRVIEAQGYDYADCQGYLA
jgi:hypothetical protein